MATGYLVTLGDGDLDPGDIISGGSITFTDDVILGDGRWIFSGAGFTNESEPGVFIRATDGNTYFVPDLGSFNSSTIINGSVEVAPLDGVVEGAATNDQIDADYTGDPEGDVITENADSVTAGGGDDRVISGGGDDTIDAGTGNDSVSAGTGNDTIDAGTGNDSVSGDAGNDTIDGGDGNDVLIGDGSSGSVGEDSISGGDGQDIIYGDNLVVDGTTASSSTFEWSTQGVADEADVSGGLSGLTTDGDIRVTLSVDQGANFGSTTMETNDPLFDFNTASDTSSIEIFGGTRAGDGSSQSGVASNAAVINLDFSAETDGYIDEVSNVTFGIFDLDELENQFIDQIIVSAFDADGNLVPVTLSLSDPAPATPTITTSVDANGVATATSIVNSGGAGNTDSNTGFVQVSVVGPVARIEIEYNNTDPDFGVHAIRLGDIQLTSIPADDSSGAADTLDGGAGADVIYGQGGDDSIQGGTGQDSLYGGDGKDIIDDSGITADTIEGGAGNDTITAGGGGDSISGGIGDDSIRGEGGADQIFGDSGNDNIRGDGGSDEIFGGADNDSLSGDNGNDTLFGGTGNDTLGGDAGNDTLDGGADNDELSGDAGNDTLISSAGDDTNFGGTGNDTFVVTDDSDGETITGGEDVGDGDIDVVDFSSPTSSAGVSVTYTGSEAGTYDFDGTTAAGSFSEIERLDTTDFDDTIDASLSTTSVTLDAGAGADTITSGTGNDTIDLGTNGAGTATDGDDDVVVLTNGFGDDVISNLEAPTPNGDGTFNGTDSFDVTGLDDSEGVPVNTNDVQVSDDGSGNAVLTFPNGESVTLIGISPTDADNPEYLAALGIPLAPAEDGVVTGSEAGDLIDAAYTGDPDGDAVDNNDQLIAGEAANDDIIVAQGGDDTVAAGDGNDDVYGGDGSDTIDAGAGDDTVYGDTADGVWFYEYYDLDPAGDPSNLAEAGFANGTSNFEGVPTDVGYTNDLDPALIDDGDDYALRFASTLIVDAAGDYTFELVSDDGARIFIDGVEVVDHDGLHGATSVTGAPIALTAGEHTIEIIYFENDNNNVLAPRISGPDTGDTFVPLSGYDNLRAATGDDVITGGTGDDALFGGTGSDTFNIAQADDTDTITGGEDADGNDVDTVTFDSVSNTDGVDVTFTGDEAGTYQVGAAGSDGTFTEIERIVGTDNADAVDLTGDSQGITVETGTGDDTITSGAGNDDIDAGTGDDTVSLNDGFGDDTIVGGEDVGDADVDVLDASGVTTNTTLDISAPETGTLVSGGDTATFSEIEEFVLGAGDDSVTGSTGEDSIDLGQGADTINAGEGDDVINLGEDSPGIPDQDEDVVVLENGFGSDLITNFDAPTPNPDGTFNGIDTLDVTNLTAGSQPVTTNDVVVTDDGSGNAVLTFPSGDNITLVGISPTDADDPNYLEAIGIPPYQDGIVSGDATDNVIDLAYTGDPDGDMVDADDALLSGEVANDDIIEGLGGNDSIIGGDGDDQIFGDASADVNAGIGEPIGQLFTDATNIQSGSFTSADGTTSINDAGAGDSIIFNDAATLDDGTLVSIRVTVVSVSDPDVTVVLNDSQSSSPLRVIGSTDEIGDTVKFKVEFLDQVTGEPLTLTGNATVVDIDDNAAIGITGSEFVQFDENDINSYSVSGTPTTSLSVTNTGGVVTATGSQTNSASDQEAWIGVGFEDRSEINFTVGVVDGTANYGFSGLDLTDPLTTVVSGGDDIIDGGVGNDYIAGNGGDDTLTGGEGDDTILGGTGTDTIFGGGGDTVIGGEDADGLDVDVLNAGVAVSVDYTDVDGNPVAGPSEYGTITYLDGTTLSFSEIETLNVSILDGTVSGTAGGDLIDGSYLGDPDGDIVDNNDAILAGDTNNDDLIEANGGDDTVFAGDGNDEVYGGTGNDTLDGGVGNDTLFGEAGNDIFTVGDADGTDTITGGEDVGDADLDIVDFSGVSGTDGVDVDFTSDEAGDYQVGTTGSDGTFTEIEGIIGTDNADDINLSGDTTGISVDAGTGDDVITGGTGDDEISAGAGQDDIIIGDDFGNDDIDGGAVADGTGDVLDGSGLTQDVTVDFSAAETGTVGNGTDTADFAEIEAIITGSGDDTVLGDSGNDVVSTGAGVDTITGGAGDDTFDAGAGNDTIDGGTGNDDITAGSGDDTVVLTDGFGDDTIAGGEDAGDADVDVLDATAVTDDTTLDLTAPETGTITDGVGTASLAEIEQFFLGSGNDTATGSVGDDFIDLGQGDDTIDAGQGDDTVAGGLGDDTIVLSNLFGNDTVTGGEDVGDTDTDTLDATGVTVNTVLDLTAPETGTITDGSDTTSLAEIEEFFLGSGDDTATGSVGNDTIDLGAGDDSINAGAGDDNITGGTGDDTVAITDGFGNDTVDAGEDVGDADVDVLDGSSLTDDVTVTLTGDEVGTVTDGVDTLSFDNVEEIETGTGDDTVIGGTGDDSVSTGAGVDTITGGAGNDTFDAGAGNDTIDGGVGDDNITAGTGDDTIAITDGFGNDTVDAGEDVGNADVDVLDGSGLTDDVTVTLTGDEVGTVTDGVDTLSFDNVEEIETGAGDDTVIGGTGDDSVSTGAGVDTITGGAGNDTFDAGAGNDTIDGGVGDDNITAGTGDDTVAITDGFGNDTVDAGEDVGDADVDVLDGSGLTDDVTVTLTGDEVGTVTNATDTLSFGDVEEIITGSGDDTVVGGTGDDSVSTGAGDDIIAGGAGADTFDAGAGNDTITFSEGDSLAGGDGDDLFVYENLGEPTNGVITVTGGDGDETAVDPVAGTGGDILQLGDLADLSTLVQNSDGINASGNETFSGTVTLDDGTILNFSGIEQVICFTPGTNIATPLGSRPIETLRVGDLVVTRDHGLQPIRWIQQRTVPATDKFAPVRLRPGTVTGLERDLLVSPQHRMLFQGYRAELLFGESEVLMPATHLVDHKMVTREEGGFITYIHMMFDEHEVVYAEGAASESFHPGEIGLTGVSDAAREELFALFPQLRSDPKLYGRTARRTLKKHESQMLRTK